MASSYNVQSRSEILKINQIRQSKILKAVNDRNTMLEVEDPLSNDFILNFGPQHPSTHGVLRILMRIDGETIVRAIPELGYLHRGMEKIAENMTYHNFIPFTDRLDYLAPLSNNTAYTHAVENAIGLEIPERAKWIRSLICEMARISSHLMATGSTCMDLGATTVLVWTFTEREKLYDIMELMTGARFTVSYSRIGGVAHDLSDKVISMLRTWAEAFPKELLQLEHLINRNRIFIDRIAGVGVVSAKDALDLGLTGPTLRGSGVKRDLRKDEPYFVYDKLDFNVVTYPDGDVFSRYMVRIDEMKESCKMILQILDKMPKGDVICKDSKYVLPRKAKIYTGMENLINDFMLINNGSQVPDGETYTAIESPKGELGFFIVSNGSGYPWRLKIHSPCTTNLQSLQMMLEGSMISDAVACIGSIDPIMGEADK